jgi:hypothetical protein
MIGVELL